MIQLSNIVTVKEAVVGLITKHGILIVEFANQQQEHGKDRFTAVIDAAALRLRPILMTTGQWCSVLYPWHRLRAPEPKVV